METLSKTPYLGRHGRHSESLIQDRLQSIKNLEQAQWTSLRNKRDRGELAYKPTFYGKILTLLYTIAVFGLGVVVGLLISFFF